MRQCACISGVRQLLVYTIAISIQKLLVSISAVSDWRFDKQLFFRIFTGFRVAEGSDAAADGSAVSDRKLAVNISAVSFV